MFRQIETFIEEGRQAGRRIGDENERWTSQGYLDYWATTLYSHADNVPSTELEAFDEDTAPTLLDEDCPYVGLRAFEENDATLFFGRETDSKNLAEKLLSCGFVVVTGPSGAGKSSLIGAGLIPRLKKEHPSEGDWQNCVWMYPGEDPQKSRAKAEKELNGGLSPRLLVVDQLEEVFTLCSEEQEQDKFIDWLFHLTIETEPNVFVVAALSEDHLRDFRNLAESKQFDDIEKRLYIFRIGPLETSRLRNAIVKPARLRNLQFEPKVIDCLVDDLSAEPTVLPLLQFTLLALWKRKKGNRIKYEHYVGIGDTSLEGRSGAKNALAACAERLYREMPTIAEKVTLKNIFLRLVKLGEDGEIAPHPVREDNLMKLADADMVEHVLNKIREVDDGGTSRAYTVINLRKTQLNESELEELRGNLADKQMVREILIKLGKAGLIRRFESSDEHGSQVEIAHEVLVRNWTTLRDWVRNRRVREELELKRELKRATATWAANARNSGLLWTDTNQIKTIHEKPEILWRANDTEKGFLKESQSKARLLKTLKLVSIVGGFFAVGTVSGVFIAYQEQKMAYQAQRTANLQAGLEEIYEPFRETWGLQIKYRGREPVLDDLPKVVKYEIESRDSNDPGRNSELTNLVRFVNSEFLPTPLIEAFRRFELVQGQPSDCAIVRLTRRTVYGNEENWIWSGFTTKFRFPGSNVRMYMTLLGNTSEKEPQEIPIGFTQYNLKDATRQNQDQIIEDPPLINYTILFKQNDTKYKGELSHPILKDDNGNSIPIATFSLEQSPINTKGDCDSRDQS
jgi:hypothetical protein